MGGHFFKMCVPVFLCTFLGASCIGKSTIHDDLDSRSSVGGRWASQLNLFESNITDEILETNNKFYNFTIVIVSVK